MAPAAYSVLALLTFPVAGALDVLLIKPGDSFGPMVWPQSMTLMVLCFLWCKAHAHARGVEPPSGAALLCGIFAPLGIPLYLFRTKGLRGGAISTSKVVAVAVLAVALNYLAVTLVSAYVSGRPA